MNEDYVDIKGITPQCDLPNCAHGYPYKQICETLKLTIPYRKPEIDTIRECYIDTSIKQHDIICSPIGKKLIIYGLIHIKIRYESYDFYDSTYSAQFDIPFCNFVLLDNAHKEIDDIKIFIEDAFIQETKCNSFYISTFLVIYPSFKQKDNYIELNNQTDLSSFLDSNIGSNLGSNIGSNLGSNIGSNLGSNIGSNLGSNLGSNMDSKFEYNSEYNIELDTISTNTTNIPNDVYDVFSYEEDFYEKDFYEDIFY
ncbi:SPOCS domain-containing protein [Oceanirhabdus sp. W0125-5]|uniref:SPOCS domain-containing protein n=1 Tax=Oceanirhabdus sp. W0125-5 TaxID=2999116 RepID=UPI0022F2AB1A|nr:SPOCS domain-containing protein [Oceanirhabdus sp. W0125-5]WBW96652.1 DUF3794 domain-containing protein [Oceanirhabdus sp. W0125-5]